MVDVLIMAPASARKDWLVGCVSGEPGVHVSCRAGNMDAGFAAHTTHKPVLAGRGRRHDQDIHHTTSVTDAHQFGSLIGFCARHESAIPGPPVRSFSR